METIDCEWRGFIEFCQGLKTKENIEEFFDLIFTIEEKIDLTKRLQVIRCLLEGKMTQREISKKINVSIFKITRGSNALKIISKKLEKYLEKELVQNCRINHINYSEKNELDL